MEAARALNIKSSKKRKMETDVDEPPERLIHGLLHFIKYFFLGGGGRGVMELTTKVRVVVGSNSGRTNTQRL